MQQITDLFGDLIAQPSSRKPKEHTSKMVVSPLKVDRRTLWGSGSHLSNYEDDDTRSILGTESFTENSTIERLEAALFMSPVVKKGEWVRDGTFYAYRVTKLVMGPKTCGTKGTMLHDCTMLLIKSSAQKVLDTTFDDTGSWLPKWAYWLFCYRLLKADVSEDPYELLKAFTAVMSQQDFLDASRKGESLRRLTKRFATREKRAKARLEDSETSVMESSSLKSA